MAARPDEHFLIVAYPTFGHIIPLLTFTKKVSDYNFVTIIISSSFIEVLEKRGLLASFSDERVKLFPLDDGVPAEREVGLTPDVAVQRVVRVVELMGEALEVILPKLLSSLNKSSDSSDYFPSAHQKPVHAVIVEQFLPGRVIPFAEDHKLPCFVFCSDGRLISMPQFNNMPEKPNDNQKMILGVFGDMRARNMKWTPFAKGQIFNVFREAEPEAVAAHEKNPRGAGIPILCVGPLFPAETSTSSSHAETERITTWLDSQPNNFVVYVSFGTVVNLAPPQMEEIFKGLLATGKPFIWSLKQQDQEALSADLKQKIVSKPDVSRSPFLVVPWAPQKAVLLHRAAGVFVTHGGWNSITEGMFCGVPMVVWPMMLDQHSNGDWIEKRGAGIKVPNTQMGLDGRVVTGEELVDYLEKVGGWSENHQDCREEARKLSKLAKDAIAEGGSSSMDFFKVINV